MHTTPFIRAALVVAAVAALGLLSAAPSAQGKPAGEQAGQVPSGELPKPLVIPEAEKKRTNPVPNVAEAIEAGKTTYGSQCAMCHGAKGDGRGDLAVSMKMKIASFATAAYQAKRTDGELFYIMTTGHGDMPGEKRLPDQAKWEIVRYLRTFGPSAGAPAKK
jgi:mono/diheme cytochrome c family protein